MGRTIIPMRNMVDHTIWEFKKFRDALRKEDRELFDRLMVHPKQHISAITYTNSLDVFSMMLLSIALEQEKVMAEMKKDIEALMKKMTGLEEGYLEDKQRIK
ncbi:hypothetical protein HYU14_06495 [Candidatus Woesearchaeota archaeon]|nr:hypothetical protein [Candidatus Woesearchaeota archaeon]